MTSADPAGAPADAVILASHGNRGIGETPDGTRLKLHFLRSVGRPCCGDYVTFEQVTGGANVVTAILPRKNEFARANQAFEKQVIAANLDQVFIVIAPRPAPSRDLVERYLIAVHSLHIEPIIVVNKWELLNQDDWGSDSPLGRIGAYRKLGYGLIPSSCKSEPGVNGLRSFLDRRVSIFVGQSGVGKSSLIKALIPNIDIQVGDLSESSGKGRHTTTSTHMYRVDDDGGDGGRIIDSPGVWEYGLWRVEPDELARGFIEFRPHLGRCRFNDCVHQLEPGCAVKNAAESGEIMPWRYEAYLRLLDQQ